MVKEDTRRVQSDILTPALWGCPESRSTRPSSSCPLGAHSRSQGWRTEMGLPEEGTQKPLVVVSVWRHSTQVGALPT